MYAVSLCPGVEEVCAVPATIELLLSVGR